MADLLATAKTTLSQQETVVRAVQFFAREKFRTSSQSDRMATFDGMPPIPWFMLLLTIIGFNLCVVPGVIIWFLVIRKSADSRISLSPRTLFPAAPRFLSHAPNGRQAA